MTTSPERRGGGVGGSGSDRGPAPARARPEVLAPAGSPACLPAAVAGGADAVFLGLRHFNARGRAENFRKADLPHHVAYLHGHGLKCYVVMNTLVHDDEYPKALDLAGAAAQAGVDALIIQDLGLWRALAREFPALPRHASTQMTVHHPSQIEVLAGLGAERVILARELSLAEVAACTESARALGVQTEHFVHGALCYAYSGACLMSNFAGCRSANRGTCAQNCRFDYQRLAGDGSAVAEPTSEISMKDLALVGQVGALANAGVASFKIEGRLKGPDYVYTVSRVYAGAVAAWADGRHFDLAGARELLKDIFARAPSAAPLLGDYSAAARLHRYQPQDDRQPDAELVSLDRQRGTAVLASRTGVVAGQGFSFSIAPHTGGFLVTAADAMGSGRWRCRVRIAEHGPHLPAGLALFRNADHQRKREANEAMARVALRPAPEPTVGLTLAVRGRSGMPMTVQARSADGRQALCTSAMALQPATSAGVDGQQLTDKLGGLGGTPFHLAALTTEIAPGLFLPAAELKALRRRLVADLESQPALPSPGSAITPGADAGAPAAAATATAATAATAATGTDDLVAAQVLPGASRPDGSPAPQRRDTRIWVAVGDLAAARVAIAAGAAAVWLEDPCLDLWADQAPVVDASGLPPGQLWLRHAATAPLSPHLAALGMPVVAGHLGVIAAARRLGLPVIADHSCNVFGLHTLSALAELGASAAVLSLECSSREVARLAGRRGVSGPGLALVAHGRLPAMLTRQDHGLALGAVSALRATAGDGGLPYQLQRRRPRDTVVWEGRRLCAPLQVQATAGLVDAWLLELADLPAGAVAELVRGYVGLRDGTVSPEQIMALAGPLAPFGTFPGHLEQGSRELDAVQERLQDARALAE